MERIAGIMIPDNKRIKAGLTLIYGIGQPIAKQILEDLKIDGDTFLKDLSENDLNKIRDYIAKMPVEGDLRRKIQLDIKRLQEIGCYRGQRHRRHLPVRGQRTKTNARTRKGKRRTVANKKKVTK
ncbi:30S ribosomal protein S13 [Candidatus Peregrinibacteria bacterium CG_4_9_14_0_2_um_filter_53_11]|nr:MAG: 30S ribosomal protein S13 [Candidatus Peregrinibacteria bacterium CG_4_9_14_0_2_um_filter_53_11]